MTRESLAELNAIEPRLAESPGSACNCACIISCSEKAGRSAFASAEKLCRVAPNAGAGFLHAGFCLHQLGKTAAARKLLAHWARHRFAKEPIYYYNMGCYEALLGNVDDARRHLQNQLRDGRILSRTGEERSGPRRRSSAVDLSASRRGGLQVDRISKLRRCWKARAP